MAVMVACPGATAPQPPPFPTVPPMPAPPLAVMMSCPFAGAAPKGDAAGPVSSPQPASRTAPKRKICKTRCSDMVHFPKRGVGPTCFRSTSPRQLQLHASKNMYDNQGEKNLESGEEESQESGEGKKEDGSWKLGKRKN